MNPDMRTFLLALYTAAAVCALGAENTPREALLVLAKADSTLAIVDPSSLQIVARVPAGPDPHEVIASSDGRFAYISNYGGGAYNTLTVVDLVQQKNLAPVDLGALRGPHGLVFAGGKVWFTAEAAKAIGSYDPETQKIDWVLGTGQDRTHMIFVWEDLKRIITTNVSAASVSIIEKRERRPGGPGPGGPPPPRPGGRGPMGPPGGDWEETVVGVGRGDEGFDVSPDGKQVWVANAQDGTVSIMNVAAKSVTRTLDANVKGANRLKFTRDGKLVFITSLSGENLVILDAATGNDVKRLKIGHGAAGILMHPDGTRAFVACSPDNYVAVVDLQSLEVRGHLEVGKDPDGLAWASHR
jgi:YVTN family beta-propeller protein